MFPHMSMMNGKKKFRTKKRSFAYIVQPTTRSMLGVYDGCPPLGKLPGTFALLAVLCPVHPRSIKSSSTLHVRHARDEICLA